MGSPDGRSPPVLSPCCSPPCPAISRHRDLGGTGNIPPVLTPQVSSPAGGLEGLEGVVQRRSTGDETGVRLVPLSALMERRAPRHEQQRMSDRPHGKKSEHQSLAKVWLDSGETQKKKKKKNIRVMSTEDTTAANVSAGADVKRSTSTQLGVRSSTTAVPRLSHQPQTKSLPLSDSNTKDTTDSDGFRRSLPPVEELVTSYSSAADIPVQSPCPLDGLGPEGSAQKSPTTKKRVTFVPLSTLLEKKGSAGHEHRVSDGEHGRKKERGSHLAKDQPGALKTKKKTGATEKTGITPADCRSTKHRAEDKEQRSKIPSLRTGTSESKQHTEPDLQHLSGSTVPATEPKKTASSASVGGSPRYRISHVGDAGRKDLVVPGPEEKQPAVSVKIPPRHNTQLTEQQRSQRHRHRRHHEKVSSGERHHQWQSRRDLSGKVHHHGHWHNEKVAGGEVRRQNLEPQHRLDVGDLTDPTRPPPHKPKVRLSLAGYKERRRQNVEDRMNSASSETQPRSDSGSKDTDSDGLRRSSLAEELIMSYNRRPQSTADVSVKAGDSFTLDPIFELDPTQNIKQSDGGGGDDHADCWGYLCGDVFGVHSTADTEVVGDVCQLDKTETEPMGKTAEPTAKLADFDSPESPVEIHDVDTLDVWNGNSELMAETRVDDSASKSSPESPAQSDTSVEPDEMVLPEEWLKFPSKTGLHPDGGVRPIASEQMAGNDTEVLARVSNLETLGKFVVNAEEPNEVVLPEELVSHSESALAAVTRETGGIQQASAGVEENDVHSESSEDLTAGRHGSELVQAELEDTSNTGTAVQVR